MANNGLIFGPLIKWGRVRQGKPAKITDPLYERMVANPEQRVPFLLTDKAKALR